MPRDNPLFTLLLIIAVCLHTVKLHVCMLWLTMIIPKPAAARRTIAIELLRRLDQMEDYRRRSLSTPALHPRFADSMYENRKFIPMRFDCRGRRPSAPSTKTQFRLPGEDACIEAPTRRQTMPNSSESSYGTNPNTLLTHDASGPSTNQIPARTGSVHSSSSRGVWTNVKLKQPRDVKQVRLPAESNECRATATVGAELTPPTSPSKEVRLPDARYGTHDYVLIPQRGGSQQLMVEQGKSGNEAAQSGDGRLPYGPDELDWTPPLSDLESSGSDAMFTEGFRSLSPLSGKLDAGLEDDTVEGAEEDEFDSPNCTLVSTTEQVSGGVDEPHRREHRRNISMDSECSAKRKTSLATLRARSKTNGGLLQLKANTTRPKASKPTCIHWRNVSINLPIQPPSAQPEGTQRTQPQPYAPSAPTPKLSSDETSTAAQIERELQYKHRHIFVGTASLHSFLATLETSSLGSTSRLAVMRAFRNLASNEQLLYRQASSDESDWNLVTRVTPDISTFDCVTLARIQLGSVSLQQFVDSIPFNILDEAPTAVVVEAFKNASHMDAEEGLNARSKARAFRKWVLSQNNTAD